MDLPPLLQSTDLPFAMAKRSIMFSPTSFFVFGLEEFPALSDLRRPGFADESYATCVEVDGL